MLCQLDPRGTRIFPQVGNPSREAHEGRAELVGRLPSHGDPQPVARGGNLRAVGPPGEQRQAQEHRAFERGDTREPARRSSGTVVDRDRKSTRLNSSHITISYAVFCLKKKTTRTK